MSKNLNSFVFVNTALGPLCSVVAVSLPSPSHVCVVNDGFQPLVYSCAVVAVLVRAQGTVKHHYSVSVRFLPPPVFLFKHVLVIDAATAAMTSLKIEQMKRNQCDRAHAHMRNYPFPDSRKPIQFLVYCHLPIFVFAKP